MPIELSRINKDHVTSWQHIETPLVDPSQRMHIMSGIAVPRWEVNDDDKIYRDLCIVSLGVTIPDFIQAACQVGLASVSNGESSFLFALDDSWAEPDQDTGELKLKVNLAVNGEKSSLARFGFQIVVLGGNRITGVSGHVRWLRDIFDPGTLTDGRNLLLVNAFILETINPGIPGSFAFDKLTPIGSTIPGEIHLDGDDFSVPYAFEHLPLGVNMRFTVTLSQAFASNCSAGQISGPNPVKLTPTHLSETGVDFRVIRTGVN
jgi:hypothetical protein